MFNQQLTARQRDRLKETIARGKQSFLWKRGVLLFGLTSYALFFVLDYLFWRTRIHGPVAPEFISVLLVSLPIWLVGGYLWGLAMWGYYNRLLRSQRW